MPTLYPKITESDWSFMGTWREEAARSAAGDVTRNNPAALSTDIEDAEQHALLYCATHPSAVNRYRTEVALRRHVGDRLRRDFKRDWDRNMVHDGFGTEAELYGEGLV